MPLEITHELERKRRQLARTRLRAKFGDGEQAAAPRTHGLSHIALAVRDLDRAVDFYTRAFGAREYYRDERSAQVLGPGAWDVLAFELDPERAGKAGGAIHFGFRLTSPQACDTAVAEVEAAGGRIKERGDFGPDAPFAFVEDPDGYEIELWYESTPPHEGEAG